MKQGVLLFLGLLLVLGLFLAVISAADAQFVRTQNDIQEKMKTPQDYPIVLEYSNLSLDQTLRIKLWLEEQGYQVNYLWGKNYYNGYNTSDGSVSTFEIKPST